MSMIIHQSGIDAAINAQADGFSGATLSYVDLFDGSTKIKRQELKGVQVIEPSRIYVVAQDSTTETYDITKMEFITDGGVLFATVQHDDGSVIQSKGPATAMVLAEQLNLSAAPGSVAPSGDVSIYAPQATEDLLGTAEIATQDEANGNTDDTRFITPKKLYNRSASTSRRGVVELATQSETDTGTSTVRAIVPATLASRLLSFTRNATETVNGFAELATQTEADAGTDDSRIITPKKLWSILTAKFARIDERPTFDEGINTGGKPIIYSGSGTNVDHIWYHDGDNEFHLVADREEGAVGNANLKIGGIQLTSGVKVTGVSDSATSTSKTTLASSYAVDVARDDGTRQATETQRGQAEIATQAETDAGTDHTRMVTPKTLASRLTSLAEGLFKSAAYLDAGQNDGQVALLGNGGAYVVQSGSNANGNYRIWSDGAIEQWGFNFNLIGGGASINFPIPFSSATSYTFLAIEGARGSSNQQVGAVMAIISNRGENQPTGVKVSGITSTGSVGGACSPQWRAIGN